MLVDVVVIVRKKMQEDAKAKKEIGRKRGRKKKRKEKQPTSPFLLALLRFRSYNFAGFLSERQRAIISLRLASKALIIWRVSVEWQEVLDDTENQRLVDLNP